MGLLVACILFRVAFALQVAPIYASARRAGIASAHRVERALHQRVAGRKRIKAYLKSSRRLPFNNDDIFRHYPELDE